MGGMGEGRIANMNAIGLFTAHPRLARRGGRRRRHLAGRSSQLVPDFVCEMLQEAAPARVFGRFSRV